MVTLRLVRFIVADLFSYVWAFGCDFVTATCVLFCVLVLVVCSVRTYWGASVNFPFEKVGEKRNEIISLKKKKGEEKG